MNMLTQREAEALVEAAVAKAAEGLRRDLAFARGVAVADLDWRGIDRLLRIARGEWPGPHDARPPRSEGRAQRRLHASGSPRARAAASRDAPPRPV